MLDQNIKDQVRSAFSALRDQYTFQIKVSQDHPKYQELISLLEDVANCSDQVNCTIDSGQTFEFKILKNAQDTGIKFRAVPNGHEFTTLLLGVLNSDGIGKNMPDELLSARIHNIDEQVHLKSYVSLTCTNCPQVVQALNIMAILNPKISHEIVDGSLFKEEVDALDIQAVPTVLANDEVLHIGRSTLGELFNKLEQRVETKETQLTSMELQKYDVVIAGGGPAGVSAAIYSARKGFSVALIAEKIGGQVAETVDIENLISIPKTTGTILTANLTKHLNEYPIDVFENRRIEACSIGDEGYKNVTTNLGESFVAPALIISTGASWRKLGIPGEDKYLGSGVAFCAHCDGPFYKGKKVIVVGGGNSGLEAAIDLSSIASEVTLLEYASELQGDRVLQDKIQTIGNINVLTSSQSLAIHGDDNKVNALKYQDRRTGEIKELAVDGIFVQIGLNPNSQVFDGLVETNTFKEIIVDAGCRTNQAGIYAAGDVTIVPYKQIVIAMGEGSKAALSAFEDNIKNLQLQTNNELELAETF